MRIEEELKRGKKFDLISFDIFDTLIERDVLNPTDIFYLAGLELFKDEDEAKLFRERRIKAESDARKKSDTGEVNLKDIYRELFVIYGISAGILKEREFVLEVKHCKARDNWKTLLEAFIRSGKRVVLISDMYLSSTEIIQMLSECGIKGYEKLFVSQEYGCDKNFGCGAVAALRDRRADACGLDRGPEEYGNGRLRVPVLPPVQNAAQGAERDRGGASDGFAASRGLCKVRGGRRLPQFLYRQGRGGRDDI